jgi:hypothetical protein
VVARTAKFPRMYFNNFQDSDTEVAQVSFIFKGTLKMNERLVFQGCLQGRVYHQAPLLYAIKGLINHC